MLGIKEIRGENFTDKPSIVKKKKNNKKYVINLLFFSITILCINTKNTLFILRKTIVSSFQLFSTIEWFPKIFHAFSSLPRYLEILR